MKPETINIKSILENIPERIPQGHKKTYGHLLVIAGSLGLTGASVLSTMAALRSGCGYVTLGCPASLVAQVDSQITEAVKLSLPETDKASLNLDAFADIYAYSKNISAIAIGPGLSTHAETSNLVRKLVPSLSIPMALDADALAALEGDKALLRGKSRVMTPHPGEFQKLTGIPKADICKNPGECALSFAKTHGITVVLKGAPTVVSDGERIYVNDAVNPGLSTAGTGDVLTGIIGGFLAQGMEGFEASVLGVFIHGQTGVESVKQKGMMGLIARDLIEMLPMVLKKYERVKK